MAYPAVAMRQQITPDNKQNNPGTKGYEYPAWTATASGLTVEIDDDNSNGWKPCKMGVLANYCSTVLSHHGVSDERIAAHTIRFKFVEDRDSVECMGCAGRIDDNTTTIQVSTTKRSWTHADQEYLNINRIFQVITHELIHVVQFIQNRLGYSIEDGGIKMAYFSPDREQFQMGFKSEIAYEDQAWEWEANTYQKTTLCNILNPDGDTSIHIRTIKGCGGQKMTFTTASDQPFVGGSDEEATDTARFTAFCKGAN
tara:strand:+ start:103 stop:867 length:765 start_codon:yes stop_codon:yes gene_type:complete